jgi:multidrug efflux pump
MSGLVGRMFREFALTLTIAVVVSAIVSLTLTPMMCAKAAAPGATTGRQPGHARLNALVDGTVAGYGRSLEWVPAPPDADAAADGLTVAATVWLYLIVPKGFLPLQDTGLITAVTEAGTEVSFGEMQRLQKLGRRQGYGRTRT